jgi:tetraacyldisaccharide 4'-kinase
MNAKLENFFRGVIGGSRRGPAAMVTRALLSATQPFYAGATIVRNRLFDARLFSTTKVAVPVLSVGNITTGGTGKTPMVRWLVSRLRQSGHNVGVLARGYKADTGLGDEMVMLDHALNTGTQRPVLLRAHPRRALAAQSLLRDAPQTDVLVLDDGFQHRRLVRDLDVVLLSAVDPFGGGHLLPRGWLREPLRELRRASALVLTHADQISPADQRTILARLERLHPGAPRYRATHSHDGLRAEAASSEPPDRSLNDLAGRKFFAFAGIANPAVLHRQLAATPGECVGQHWFDDHHRYTTRDLANLRDSARAAGAELLITTEKDWVKVSPLCAMVSSLPEVWRIDATLRFLDDDEDGLWRLVQSRCPAVKVGGTTGG